MRFVNRFRTPALCLSLAFVAGAVSANGQTTAPAQKSPVTISPSTTDSTETHTWTTEQILTCTVSDCWQLSGKNEEEFFDIVQQLAAISAHNRGLVLPESEAAGRRAGELIKRKAKADHSQLLYAVVDEAVKKVGTKAPAQ